MTAAAELIDRAKKRVSAENFSVFADRIGVSRQVISAWRNGREPVPQERIAQLANMAGEDLAEWNIRLQHEQANGEMKASLTKVLHRLGIAAAVALCAVLSPGMSHASTGYKAELPANAYYVN